MPADDLTSNCIDCVVACFLQVHHDIKARNFVRFFNGVSMFALQSVLFNANSTTFCAHGVSSSVRMRACCQKHGHPPSTVLQYQGCCSVFISLACRSTRSLTGTTVGKLAQARKAGRAHPTFTVWLDLSWCWWMVRGGNNVLSQLPYSL